MLEEEGGALGIGAPGGELRLGGGFGGGSEGLEVSAEEVEDVKGQMGMLGSVCGVGG